MSSLKEMTLEIDQLLNKAKQTNQTKEVKEANQTDDSLAHKISARDCFTPTDMQLSAMEKIKKFLINAKGIEGKDSLKSDECVEGNFILMGPAGSGKTTVIAHAIHGAGLPNINIAFCAFTNKATQVLKNSINKLSLNINASFYTIHRLLQLEPNLFDEEGLSFKFNIKKILTLKDYDVIVFDECSTISKELFGYIVDSVNYIKKVYDKRIKLIFLGDFWQLAPVGEVLSIIFEKAIKDKWQVSKLGKVMRSANDKISRVNTHLLSCIDKFRNYKENTDFIDNFVAQYPRNLIGDEFFISNNKLYSAFIKVWLKDKINSCVILTYTRKNCEKINFVIEDLLDQHYNREPVFERTDYYFHAGDRCCLDRPIEAKVITTVENINGYHAVEIKDSDKEIKQYYIIEEANLHNRDINNKEVIKIMNDYITDVNSGELPESHDEMIKETKYTNITNKFKLSKGLLEETEFLFNGEIFDIVKVEDGHCFTCLNGWNDDKELFTCQILTVKKINIDKEYKIIHIPEKQIIQKKKQLKKALPNLIYLTIVRFFNQVYPKLTYGYSITIYKSQGSEWDTVFINLNSIKYSIVNSTSTAPTLEQKKTLFKSTYTAISRAKSDVWVVGF